MDAGLSRAAAKKWWGVRNGELVIKDKKGYPAYFSEIRHVFINVMTTVRMYLKYVNIENNHMIKNIIFRINVNKA